MNGVIWSKTQETFVPISSVPVFAMMQKERLRQSRALETRNFQLQNLTLTSFQEPYFLEFYDNDTKVTGICGELWTLLSEKLNFTLQPVRSIENSVGLSSQLNDSTISEGLLGIIYRNETMAIPKVETYSSRLIAIDFTMPLWMNSQRFYIQSEIMHDITWMTKIFSWKVWCFILIMYILLSICSFWSQIIFARIRKNYRRSTINDHIFYNFGMICNQSYIPDTLLGRSRILEVSLGLFCSLLYMAFGALLFIYITKRININPPFHNIDTLFNGTSYKVVTFEGSIGDLVFTRINKMQPDQHIAPRVIVVSTIEEMFKVVCTTDDEKRTVLQGEDDYKARSQLGCHTIPIGESIGQMWIASGINKNFKYKKTIDLGILRLKEVGLWTMLMERWLTDQNQYNTYEVKAEGIELDQVSLVISILCIGITTALIIFIIEKIVYTYKHKSS